MIHLDTNWGGSNLWPFCNGPVTAEEDLGGVRPSSGAASTEWADALDCIPAPLLSNIAPPEDGRTPIASPPPSLTRCAVFTVVRCKV